MPIDLRPGRWGGLLPSEGVDGISNLISPETGSRHQGARSRGERSPDRTKATRLTHRSDSLDPGDRLAKIRRVSRTARAFVVDFRFSRKRLIPTLSNLEFVLSFSFGAHLWH